MISKSAPIVQWGTLKIGWGTSEVPHPIKLLGSLIETIGFLIKKERQLTILIGLLIKTTSPRTILTGSLDNKMRLPT